MKRSKINSLIKETIAWLESINVKLPNFAYYTLEEWKTKKIEEYQEIFDNMLGWDITDFNNGNFENQGLLLFTLRNGNLHKEEYTKPYAEKMLISQPNQVTPIHFHLKKMEDIINRFGGELVVKLWNAKKNGEMNLESDVITNIDGRKIFMKPGKEIILKPGEGMTLLPYQYHSFWAKGEKVLAWEVSMVNDDNVDNYFFEKQSRFSEIEEDEPPLYLLCNEYNKIFGK